MNKMLFTVALLAFLTTLHSGNRNAVVHADNAPKWTKIELPLTVYHDDHFGIADAEGFWQATSSNKDKQLVSPIAVEIKCRRDEKVCRESEATVFLGVLKAELLEYDVSSWDNEGIVADDGDVGNCGLGHRLSIDFKSNSVTVTDYPKKVSSDKNCQAFQDASSYALHGGQFMLYPPVPFDPLAKADGQK